MVQFEKHFVQDLTQDIKVRHCGSIVFNADNLSNVVSVDLYNGKVPASVSGTVVGAVIAPDGATVPVDNGAISGNTVSITLTRACCALPGNIGVGIQVVIGDVATTVLKAIYNVELFNTDIIVDPDSRITLSLAEIEAKLDEIPIILANAQAAIDGIEAQKNTMIASIASVAGQGTDTTLTQSGVAADAKATGDQVRNLNSAVDDTAIIADKNYIPKIITGTYATNGLYFVVNADNSITVNGMSSAATDYYILNTRDSNNVRLDLVEGKHYTLSSGADFKDGVVYRLITGGGSDITQGIGRDIDIIAGKYVVLILRISNGVSFSDWHIYPMIRDTVYNDDYKAGRDYYGLSDGVSKALIPVIGECADSEITKAASLYNGIRISSEIYDNVITTMVDSSIAAHDGTLLFNNGMLYAVYCTYTGNQGDAAVNPNAKVMLTKCAVDGSNKSSIIIAENGGIYASVEQTGGAGTPNAYIANGKIYILYVANMGNTYVEMEAEYDLFTSAITYHKVQVGNSDLNNVWINSHYGKNYQTTNYLYAQANSTIAYDGTAYYIGWVYGVYEDYGAIIFKTTDFVNWEIFYEYDGVVVPSYEFPLAFLNGALCCAIRPKTVGYGLYFQIANRHVSNAGYFPNCSSRPAFFVHGTTLFMVTNIGSREHMGIYRIDQNAVQNSIKVFDCCMGANYPSFALDSANNVMYFLRTNSNMQLSKFEFNFTSESAVQDVIASTWSLA